MEKLRRYYGQLLVAAAFSLGIVFSAAIPAGAADINGKTVTEVTVTGNSTIADSDIMSVVKVKPGNALTADAVKQDMQAIYELGYFFDVVTNFTEVPEGVKVVYTVLENPVLTDIVIQGNTKVPTDKLTEILKLEKGKILNTKTLNENARGIEQYYRDQGYILAKVSDVSMSPAGVLTVSINEGVLEDIKIKGNDKTKDYVITREMKLKTGEPFNAKDARRGMQRVYNLGYFEDVNMKLNPGKEPNAVVLEADVVEQKTGTFAIGGGYSESDGMIGIIELGDNNFRGTGDKVKLHWEFGGEASDRNYSIGYTRPWLDSKETSLGFEFYDMTNEYTDYENGDAYSTYDRNRKGWNLTLGRPQNEYMKNFITLKNRKDTYVEHVDDTDVSSDEEYLYDNFGLTRSVTLSRVFDNRDNVFNPTTGSYYSLSAEFAGRALGGDFNFNKYTAETRRYFDVGSDHTIAVRAEVGYADGRMPQSGKFSLGGSDTLRGYEDNEFEGDKMLLTSVEYRMPIAKKVQGVVFGDLGNAWEGEGYKLDDLKSSIGLGVRVTTPLGPVRIDYAVGSEGGKTHFSFGGQF
ncbi:putative secreted protein [Propionispora sp. 2/2-37]|uniref:BamA/OMP85 family outer membrane protein n=1 Tax=Propionispora sp. 2/2-37 TaxID=1677858 RepID=UPI0006BB63DA|nr:BamA/TamA family outer membrane protein [Propionispora sp. 2/2-37]CUH94546.1 putative secreted protein [Propionispora sp. 2/2-37]